MMLSGHELYSVHYSKPLRPTALAAETAFTEEMKPLESQVYALYINRTANMYLPKGAFFFPDEVLFSAILGI